MSWEYHTNLYEPVANWPLDDATLREVSGNVPDLPLSVETGTYRSADIVPGFRGVWGDGATVLVESTGDARIQTALAGDFTIAFYVRPTRYAATDVLRDDLFSHGVPSTETGEADNHLMSLMLEGVTNRVGAIWETTGEVDVETFSDLVLPAMVPQHIVVRRSGLTLTIFLNGVLSATFTAASLPTGGANGKFRLFGGTGSGTLTASEAVIASVVLFGEALTDCQIANLYEVGSCIVPTAWPQDPVTVPRNGGTVLRWEGLSLDGFYEARFSLTENDDTGTLGFGTARGAGPVIEIREGILEVVLPPLPVGGPYFMRLAPRRAAIDSPVVYTDGFITVVPEQMQSGAYKLRRVLGGGLRLGKLWHRDLEFPQT